MLGRRLTWKVAPLYLLVIGLCTVAIAWFAGDALRDYDQRLNQTTLTRHAQVIAPRIAQLLAEDRAAEIPEWCRQFTADNGTYCTVLDTDGRLLGNTSHETEQALLFAERPEFEQALQGQTGTDIRADAVDDQSMMYVALPVKRAGKLVAAVRIGAVSNLSGAIVGRFYGRVALIGVVTALVALALTVWVFSRRVIRPLRRLQIGAQRFAAGDLGHTLEAPASEEFVELTEVLNTMAHQLDDKIRTITSQSKERQAILASMIEGVFAVDQEQRVISLNAAAAQLLGVDIDTARGRDIMEVVRNLELQKFVARTLESDKPLEQTITLRVDNAERICQVYGSQLRDVQQRGEGAVIVLHDQTRIRQLEQVRQEFVANVSHELKTPITAIKVSVETLLAERDPEDDWPAWRFIHTIERQADRLGAIIEDLLTLARLEQEDREGEIALKPGSIQMVVRAACETCQADAAAKQIDIIYEVDSELRTRINATLVEQAVVNLLNNSIKYSAPQTSVNVTAERRGNEVVIEVTDQGPGIEPEYLPRLFERFYRTDKARSRAMGGTGLGLSIVKHVANAHGGRVSVVSVAAPDPNHGSTFGIHLPGMFSDEAIESKA